jgi:hypothetical protein
MTRLKSRPPSRPGDVGQARSIEPARRASRGRLQAEFHGSWRWSAVMVAGRGQSQAHSGAGPDGEGITGRIIEPIARAIRISNFRPWGSSPRDLSALPSAPGLQPEHWHGWERADGRQEEAGPPEGEAAHGFSIFHMMGGCTSLQNARSRSAGAEIEARVRAWAHHAGGPGRHLT